MADFGDNDGDVYNAVNKLVEILEAHDHEQEDEQHTKEVVNKISDLITKMVDEEQDASEAPLRADDVVLRPPPAPVMGSASTNRAKSRYEEPVTELPHYPTPYELWKRSHEVAPVPVKKELSNAERKRITEDVTRRLLNHQRKEHFSMMKTQHKKLAAELRGLTFAPNLGQTKKINNKLVHNWMPLYKRYSKVIETANIRRTKMEQQCRTNEMVDCTFEPDISSSARFMKRFEDGPAVEDRCIKYGLDRGMWAEQRRGFSSGLRTSS